MQPQRRKHPRIQAATAFLNTTVHVAPITPYFGHATTGKLIDLSAGGMAILLNELIPQGTKLSLQLKFPDQSELQTVAQIKHVQPRNKAYLHGVEFLGLPAFMAQKIETMSIDFIDCEGRIEQNEKDICRINCRFYSMCKKPQKLEPVFNADVALELAFKSLDDTTISR